MPAKTTISEAEILLTLNDTAAFTALRDAKGRFISSMKAFQDVADHTPIRLTASTMGTAVSQADNLGRSFEVTSLRLRTLNPLLGQLSGQLPDAAQQALNLVSALQSMGYSIFGPLGAIAGIASLTVALIKNRDAYSDWVLSYVGWSQSSPLSPKEMDKLARERETFTRAAVSMARLKLELDRSRSSGGMDEFRQLAIREMHIGMPGAIPNYEEQADIMVAIENQRRAKERAAAEERQYAQERQDHARQEIEDQRSRQQEFEDAEKAAAEWARAFRQNIAEKDAAALALPLTSLDAMRRVRQEADQMEKELMSSRLIEDVIPEISRMTGTSEALLRRRFGIADVAGGGAGGKGSLLAGLYTSIGSAGRPASGSDDPERQQVKLLQQQIRILENMERELQKGGLR